MVLEEKSKISQESKYLNTVVKRLGKVEVLPERIVCYVKDNMIVRGVKDNYYVLDFKGFGTAKKKNNLVYVINGVRFNKNVDINGENCTIIFKNCTFRGEVLIRHSQTGRFVFKNNVYGKDESFYSLGVDELSFVNDSCTSISMMRVIANKVALANSSISSMFGKVIIDTSSLNIKSGTIIADAVRIKADKVEGYNTSLEGYSEVIFSSKDNDISSFDKVEAPIIICNGEYVEEEHKTRKLNINRWDNNGCRHN